MSDSSGELSDDDSELGDDWLELVLLWAFWERVEELDGHGQFLDEWSSSSLISSDLDVDSLDKGDVSWSWSERLGVNNSD